MIMTADTARRFFQVEDPIGRTMSLPVLRNGVNATAEVTLVGVIANVKYSGLQAAPDARSIGRFDSNRGPCCSLWHGPAAIRMCLLPG